MSHRIVPYLDRPDLDDRWDETVGTAWPPFLYADEICNALWFHLFEGDLARLQFYVLDEGSDEILGIANTLSFAWDGDPASLPNGIDEILPLAVRQREQGVAPTTMCAMQAVVPVAHRGTGMAAVILEGMRATAAAHGLDGLVAPVRPSWKHRYPLIPLQRYAAWTRADGLPFDPWLRVHVRAGGTFLHVADRSQTIVGTVAQWEEWAGMVLPGSGDHLVAGALAPVAIDVEADRGVLVEPNIWMYHAVA